MESEKSLINRICLEVTKTKCRIFRNNVAVGWVGKLIGKKNAPNGFKITLDKARPLHAGLIKGSSDLIGWTTVKITPEMVGAEIAVFTALEVKMGKTRVSKEQANFIRIVDESGGIAGVVRSLDEAVELIKSK